MKQHNKGMESIMLAKLEDPLPCGAPSFLQDALLECLEMGLSVEMETADWVEDELCI